jgi:hypothetical protein
MTFITSYTSFLRVSIIIMIFPLTAPAQGDLKTASQKQDSTSLLDSTSFVEPVSRHALYTSIGYGNDMLCLGSSVSQSRPYYLGSLTYGFNNEFFASASTYHLAAFNPFLAFHTFSLSYSHVFNSWLDISTSVSRYQVTGELTDSLFNNFFYGDITIGFDWKLIYSKLSVGRIFSETSSNYYQLRNSRYFQTPEFFGDKANISFDPYATLLFGTLTQITTSDGTTTGISSPFHTSGSGKNSSGTTSTTTKTSTIFGLMEVDLGLPISFNADLFTIVAEPGYVIPMYSDTELQSSKGFVVLFSCFFRIF